jgi:hypothetical protein
MWSWAAPWDIRSAASLCCGSSQASQPSGTASRFTPKSTSHPSVSHPR